MAEDRTLPSFFKKINPRTQVQEGGLLFLGGFILLSLVFLRTFENIVNYVMFLDSLGLATVASTLFVLRQRAKKFGLDYRGFKMPFYPVLPAVFIFFLLSITVNVLLSEPRQALTGSLLLILGFPLYLLMRSLSKQEENKQNNQ